MDTLKKFAFVSFLFIMNCETAQTQTTKNEFVQLLAKAEASDQHGQGEAREQSWLEVLKQNDVNGRYWFNYGQACFKNEHYDTAISAFKKANTLGGLPPADCYLALAKCYAKKKDKARTFAALRSSFATGLRNLYTPLQEEAFHDYHLDREFLSIIGLPDHAIKDRTEGWRFDLLLLQREIKRKAVKPFRFSENKIDSAVTKIHSDIPNMNNMQIFAALSELMVMVNDGHTVMYPFGEWSEFYQNLPLEFQYFEEGLYITSADKRFENLIGAKVLRFDDKSTEDVLTALQPIIFRDNATAPLVAGPIFMRLIPLLHVLGISRKSNELNLEVETMEGRNITVMLPADSKIISRKLWDGRPDGWSTLHQRLSIPLPLYLKNQYEDYWFEYLVGQKTVYFQYNRVNSNNKEPFVQFTRRLFDFINEKPVDKLIIDIRLNPGGNTERLVDFMDQLIACKKIMVKGKLFTIMGRKTFSAAQNCATFLEKWTPAIFVGEPSASSPNFVGEELPFELPYSKLNVNISDWFHQSSWPNDYRTWIPPLIYLRPTFTNYRQGLDPALDAALKF